MTDLIEQVEDALEGARPGPWRIVPGEDMETAQCVCGKGWAIATLWGGYVGARSDAQLTALAPDMARALIAQEERLKAADALERMLKIAVSFAGPDDTWVSTARIALANYRKAGGSDD